MARKIEFRVPKGVDRQALTTSLQELSKASNLRGIGALNIALANLSEIDKEIVAAIVRESLHK